MIVGRQEELVLVDELLAAVQNDDRGLLFRGEPGIGKTTLLDELVDRAGAQGITVLRTSPSQAESSLALVGIGDLLSEASLPLLADLPPPQRRALETALLLREPVGPATEQRVLAVAVCETLRRLAASAPLVLAIDDVQWLDRPSGEILDFAVRRLVGRRVALAATARAEHGSALPIDVARVTSGGLRDLVLGPLTVAALFRLLRERLGLNLSRPALIRVHEACGGNPLFALEIGRELQEGRIQLQPGEPVPLPGSLLGLVEQRTRRLPATTHSTLTAVAALGRAERAILDRALGVAVVERSLARAARAGVVVVDRDTVRFAHPLFASASYTVTPPHERRAIHRRLAQVMDDPEERARHLALGSARRDASAAMALEEAAAHAAARGAPAAAAELEELAIELTPLAALDDRVRRALLAIELHGTAGAREQAEELATALLVELPPGPRRSEVALALAATCGHDPVRMADLVKEALAEPCLDDSLAARLQAQLADALFRQGHAREALTPARAGLELARRSGDTRVLLGSIARVATTEFWAGEVNDDLLSGDAATGLLAEGAALELAAGLPLPFSESPRAALATRLVHLGRMDDARAIFGALLAQAEQSGDEPTRARVLWHLSQLEDYAGNWARSEELIGQAAELEEQLGIESAAVDFARAAHGAMLGRLEEVQELVAEGVARARAAGDAPYELLTLGVLGFLRFALGEDTEAAEILCGVIDRAIEISEPRVNRYWPDTIEALVATGDLTRAAQYLEVYAAAAARLRVPRSLARVAHCRGVLLSASGEAEAALAAFDEALAIHDRCPNVFERARTLMAKGVALRRCRRRGAAREAIGEALSVFELLPAPIWAGRARAELARTGVRRRSGEGLSETEELVARLAAQGLTNREIGQRAFLTPKSVEDVLRRVYRILGVRNKTELSRRLGELARSEAPSVSDE